MRASSVWLRDGFDFRDATFQEDEAAATRPSWLRRVWKSAFNPISQKQSFRLAEEMRDGLKATVCSDAKQRAENCAYVSGDRAQAYYGDDRSSACADQQIIAA